MPAQQESYVLPPESIPEAILSKLRNPSKPVVVMTCGIAGSGKSTLAKALARLSESTAEGMPALQRFSIDEYIWKHYGQHAVDYDGSMLEQYQDLAEEANREALRLSIRQGKCSILDYSFWDRETRDEYRALIEVEGGEAVLVYFDVSEATLRKRLADRALRRDANAAFEIDEATLRRYLDGFERPVDEEKITIVVA